MSWFALLACTDRPEQRDPHDSDATEPSDTAPTLIPPDTTAPGTGHTGATGPDPCAEPLPAGPYAVTTIDIQTEEDFDFDQHGRLLAQHRENLVAYTSDGQRTLLAPGLDADPAGIRVLPTGDVLVANPREASILLVSPDTGGFEAVVTGVSPNGLDVAPDGTAYLTELTPNGRIRRFDPYGTLRENLFAAWANGVTVTPDGRTMYVAGIVPPPGGGVARGELLVTHQDDAGAWAAPVPLFDSAAMLGALTTDVCGNLYGVEATGRVYRVLAVDGTIETLVTLEGLGNFSAARFGAGFGDWPRTTLYTTNRQRVYAVDVGIEGRSVF